MLAKIKSNIRLIINFFIKIPQRFWRLLRHLFIADPAFLAVEGNLTHKFFIWILDTFFYTLELIGFAEIYEILLEWFKYPTRSLTKHEIHVGKSVFGDSIQWNLVRFDQTAKLATQKKGIAYVSFNTINVHGRISDAILVHELTHIWQYQHLGAVYIIRALLAQNSKMGYNYGGLKGLKQQDELLQFNFEQQADICTDYYRIKNGKKPEWSNATENQLHYYEHFINQLATLKKMSF